MTEHEQAIYDGKSGEARSFAMNILTNIGELYNATRLVPVRVAQVSCPAGNPGREGWTELVKYYSGRRLKPVVPAFADPDAKLTSKFKKDGFGAFDTDHESFRSYLKQNEQLSGLYRRLGLARTRVYPATRRKVTLEGRTHMAISDPVTAVFLNSRYSVRTNSESSAVALASAILGRTTLSGMHLIENRIPDILVRVLTDLHPGDLTFLGLHIGARYRNSLPYFKLKDWHYVPSERELFEFSSALCRTGNVPMFHIEDFTPEYHLYRPTAIHRKVKVKSEDIKRARDKYRPDTAPDLVVAGAPYVKLEELHNEARKLSLENKFQGPPLMVFITGETAKLARDSGIYKKLEHAGARIFVDCNFMDLPLESLNVRRILTDTSALLELKRILKKKGLKVYIRSTGDCFEVTRTGVLPK